MLALVLVMALGQCTKDTDCKGYRVCLGGQCADAADAPVASPAFIPVPAIEQQSNPYRVHRWVAFGGTMATWLLTVIGSVATGDITWTTTVIPLVGPMISYARCSAQPANVCYVSPGGGALLVVSTLIQSGFVGYLLAAVIQEATYQRTTRHYHEPEEPDPYAR